nr:hypothetical protein [Mycoplasmopsis bovis]
MAYEHIAVRHPALQPYKKYIPQIKQKYWEHLKGECMARKLQRFTLSKKANITSCLGAITIPVLFSISTISCGEYYISYTEESFLIHFKLFDFKLYEKKILQTLESTNTIETLGRKYDSFNADSEFKDRFKEAFLQLC